MPKDVLYGKTLRKSFARVDEIRDMPNLLEIQKSSYKWFLETGLREVFKDVDSVCDYSGNLELSFIDYSMDEKPKYNEEECKARDATYAKPLKVRVRLRNKETEEIKEQEIFMGDFPIMTDGGTFVINGAERVIVSQIVRSPGVYFDKTTDKAMISVYASTVIPYHGAWLEYETDANDVFNVRIDKNRKLPITWFLKAMGAYDENKPASFTGEGLQTGRRAGRVLRDLLDVAVHVLELGDVVVPVAGAAVDAGVLGVALGLIGGRHHGVVVAVAGGGDDLAHGLVALGAGQVAHTVALTGGGGHGALVPAVLVDGRLNGDEGVVRDGLDGDEGIVRDGLDGDLLVFPLGDQRAVGIGLDLGAGAHVHHGAAAVGQLPAGEALARHALEHGLHREARAEAATARKCSTRS